MWLDIMISAIAICCTNFVLMLLYNGMSSYGALCFTIAANSSKQLVIASTVIRGDSGLTLPSSNNKYVIILVRI